jgi:hypothetical protein
VVAEPAVRLPAHEELAVAGDDVGVEVVPRIA